MGLTVAPTANAKTGLTREAQGARESLCLLFAHISPKRLSWCLKYSLSRLLTSRCGGTNDAVRHQNSAIKHATLVNTVLMLATKTLEQLLPWTAPCIALQISDFLVFLF